MKAKQIVFLMLEGLLVLVCVGVVYFLSITQVKPTTVYRFTKPLAANKVITKSDIEAVEIPYSAVTTDFVLNEKDIIGQATKSEVYPGEYAFTAQLKKATELTAFDSLDLTDKVKVAIPIKDLHQAVGGLLNSGDVVDLYYTAPYVELGEKSTDGAFYTTRFMEEVVVYKVLNDTANEAKNDIETGDKTIDPDTKQPIPNEGDLSMVLLAVTAEQALEIQTRLSTGTISIIGRFDETITTPVQDFVITPGDGVEFGFETIEEEK